MTLPGVVSVIVPCFNAAAYLDDALQSIRRQTYKALDIVVIDDGSTDESGELIARHVREDSRVRLFSQRNSGLAAARNSGLRLAHGEFISFLDADDVLLNDKVERQLAFLREHPECDLVYSDYLIGDSALTPVELVVTRIPEGQVLAAYAYRNWFGAMVPLLRRDLVSKVGPFDESLHRVEDWDYWIRCAKAGNFSYLPGPVAVYRTHPLQMHADFEGMLYYAKRTVEKHFRENARLRRLSLSCLYWAHAKGRFRTRNYWKMLRYLVAAEYYSLLAGGVPFRIRNVSRLVSKRVPDALRVSNAVPAS